MQLPYCTSETGALTRESMRMVMGRFTVEMRFLDFGTNPEACLMVNSN